jgi:arachidonate 15-lipoxygenase (second type)/8-lipoxygenase (S-type)
VLTNEGGIFDRYFSITGEGAEQAMLFYYASGAGAFQANYFINNLESRGLINCTYGPALKSNPFFQDASQIVLGLRRFVTSFVYSYYKSDDIVRFDYELQDWVHDATASAQVIDFPQGGLTKRETLIEMLCHFAFLTVVHNTLNGASPFRVSSTLPYHPAALHAPLPATKGVENILPWLPNKTAAINEIAVFAKMNAPFASSQNKTFIHTLHDDVFLSRLNEESKVAEQVMWEEMEVISQMIRGKAFDENGLSEGMPFLWTLLDPATMHG